MDRITEIETKHIGGPEQWNGREVLAVGTTDIVEVADPDTGKMMLYQATVERIIATPAGGVMILRRYQPMEG